VPRLRRRFLFLAACDDVPNIVAGFSKGPVVGSTITFAQSKGPMLVQVYGDPFGMSDRVFHNKVVDALQGSIQSPLIRFTRNRSEAGVSNVTFRLAFGFPKGEQAEEICKDKIPDPVDSDTQIRLRGAVCMDGELLVEADGWMKKEGTPDSAGFKRFITAMSISVLEHPENDEQ